MSWDIWVTCFRDGGLGCIPRELLERAFEGIADRSDPAAWRLHDRGGTIYLGAEPELAGFTVNRPPGSDHPFWPALMHILRQTTCVLYWPGKGCVVADRSVIAHISADFDRVMGAPTVTTNVARVFELIENA